MLVRFITPSLRCFDDLKSEAMSVPFFSDERPPRGALGMVDWRLGGRVSSLLGAGRICGNRGETVLIPARPRLTFEKLFLFGMGERAAFSLDAFDELVDRMFDTLTRARVRASTCVLPGRTGGQLDAAIAMERFLEVARRHPEHDEITLVEPADAQKTMMPLVERDRRRARAKL